MGDLRNMKEHLDRMTQEITAMKKLLIYESAIDKGKAERAWNDLLLAAEEISEKWQGPSALEEIRQQREKLP